MGPYWSKTFKMLPILQVLILFLTKLFYVFSVIVLPKVTYRSFWNYKFQFKKRLIFNIIGAKRKINDCISWKWIILERNVWLGATSRSYMGHMYIWACSVQSHFGVIRRRWIFFFVRLFLFKVFNTLLLQIWLFFQPHLFFYMFPTTGLRNVTYRKFDISNSEKKKIGIVLNTGAYGDEILNMLLILQLWSFFNKLSPNIPMTVLTKVT